MSDWGTALHISVGKKLQIHNELAELIFAKSYLSGCPHQSKHVRSAGGEGCLRDHPEFLRGTSVGAQPWCRCMRVGWGAFPSAEPPMWWDTRLSWRITPKSRWMYVLTLDPLPRDGADKDFAGMSAWHPTMQKNKNFYRSCDYNTSQSLQMWEEKSDWNIDMQRLEVILGLHFYVYISYMFFIFYFLKWLYFIKKKNWFIYIKMILTYSVVTYNIL